MRDLLNLLQQLNEAADDQAVGLTAGQIAKYPQRYATFIEYIRTGKPFTTLDGDQVILDPNEAKRFDAMYNAPGGSQFKGSLSARTKDGQQIALGKLAKTADFGGQKGGGDSAPEGKAGFKLNPAQIKITDRDINAEDFGDAITSNNVLASTDYGKVTINLAYQIMAGEGAVLPDEYRGKDTEKLRNALVDNAGEYLGVLALIYGESSFPKREQFEEWLGGTLGDLVLRFPSKQNEKLADSYAEIKNAATAHTVKISSKGTGGGAPPSMTGLKIPDHIRSNKKYNVLVEFIEMTKTTPTKEQPFRAMNIIHAHNPKAIPKKFNQFLPWTDKVIQMADQSLLAFKANRKQESYLPAKYQSVWADMGFKGDSSDGGKLMYTVKKAVVDMVNDANAIPNYEGGVLEILDMNFMQQYASYKGGKIVFTTQWPAKLDGKVTLESKSGSTDPTKGGFSFKLADTASHNDNIDMYGDDEVAGTATQSDEKFKSAAAKLTGGPDFTSVPSKEVGDVGRERRKR